jgi:ATP-binding cassette subfamily F protein uup
MSFKENQELQTIEATILTAEEEVARIEALFVRPDFHATYGREADKLHTDREAARTEVARLYARWEELERLRAET